MFLLFTFTLYVEDNVPENKQKNFKRKRLELFKEMQAPILPGCLSLSHFVLFPKEASRLKESDI